MFEEVNEDIGGRVEIQSLIVTFLCIQECFSWYPLLPMRIWKLVEDFRLGYKPRLAKKWVYNFN